MQGVPIDGIAAASAVEVALRFVTALQLANLLAERRPVPAMLADGTFKRPTLGSWVQLAKTLRNSIKTPFAPALASWPDARADKLLDQLTRERNRLAHTGQMSPGVRRDLESLVAELASEVLTTLDWLRRLELVMIVDAKLASDGRVDGRLQVFRSTDTHPEFQRAAWRGTPESEHIYLASSEPGAQALLDVQPFVRRARLATAKVEAMCLWKGYGSRGDILSSDDPQDAAEWVTVDSAARLVPFVRLQKTPTAKDATRSEAPAVEPPTLVDAASVRPLVEVSRGRYRLTILMFAALALSASIGIAVALTRSDRPTTCEHPDLAGTWFFNTHILTSRPGMEFGLGVRGHYELTLGPQVGCVFPSNLLKTGYTQDGKVYGPRLAQELSWSLSPSSRSLAALARLTRRPGDVTSADVAMRITRHGDMLVGLWRHEGADWDYGGYSGAILGQKHRPFSDTEDLKTGCFFDCVARCHPGNNPLDEATEPCVLDCARRLDNCPR